MKKIKKPIIKRKIYVVWGTSYDMNWMEGEQVRNIKDADLVVFTGGADINPELYNRKRHPYTHFDRYRDKVEVAAYEQARVLNKKIIGICRGAQLLCAMAGGILVQDSSHPYRHLMSTPTTVLETNSAHHQQQYPFESQKGKLVNFELLGWTNKLSKYSFGETDQDILSGHPEVEVALYPDINSLAIQGHPEWVCWGKDQWEKTFVSYCRNLLDTHMATKYSEKKAA